jgi:hypothetical protein
MKLHLGLLEATVTDFRTLTSPKYQENNVENPASLAKLLYDLAIISMFSQESTRPLRGITRDTAAFTNVFPGRSGHPI